MKNCPIFSSNVIPLNCAFTHSVLAGGTGVGFGEKSNESEISPPKISSPTNTLRRERKCFIIQKYDSTSLQTKARAIVIHSLRSKTLPNIFWLTVRSFIEVRFLTFFGESQAGDFVKFVESMKFRFLNKTIENRRFDYQPMHYDERKEWLNQKRELYRKMENNELTFVYWFWLDWSLHWVILYSTV